MKTTQVILRITLCVLSCALLWLLGAVGEELRNLPVYQRIGKDLEYMPAITQFFLHHFPLNAGHFWLSLTPFMILMLGVAGMSFKHQTSDLFWGLFVGVWLLAVGYFLLYVLALLAPFHILLVVLGNSPVPTIIRIIDIVIVGLLVAAWLIGKAKARKAEQPPPH